MAASQAVMAVAVAVAALRLARDGRVCGPRVTVCGVGLPVGLPGGEADVVLAVTDRCGHPLVAPPVALRLPQCHRDGEGVSVPLAVGAKVCRWVGTHTYTWGWGPGCHWQCACAPCARTVCRVCHTVV